MIKSFISSRNFKKGQDCFSNKDYKSAAEYFRKAAEDGHADAQFNLGILYGKGLGVAKNKGDALRWLGKAAGQGHTGAKKEVGLLKGLTEPAAAKMKRKDSKEGIDLRPIEEVMEEVRRMENNLKAGAEHGNHEARLLLGMMQSLGDGGHGGNPMTEERVAKKIHVGSKGDKLSKMDEKGWRGYLKSVSFSRHRELAEQGDAIVQYLLGTRYDDGDQPQDFSEAVKWYRNAAGQGHAKAQNNVGHAYVHGEGVEKDYGEAVKWFRKAADQGYSLAQFNLGMRYRAGQGVEKNLKEAFKWIKKAVDSGYEFPMAQSIIGQAYLFGEGTAQNFTEAARWLTRASEKNDLDAQIYLGWCYISGNGVSKDIESAEKLFKRAAAKGHAESVKLINFSKHMKIPFKNMHINIVRTHEYRPATLDEIMGYGPGTPESSKVQLIDGSTESPVQELYDSGIKYLYGNGVKKDEEKGAKLIIAAAEGRYAPAFSVYADILEEGEGVPQNLTESLKWRRKAAEQGDADSQFLMGYKHENGEGLPQDDVEAVNWYRKSAEQGYKEGQFHYGLMLYYGTGLPEKNQEEGMKWIRLAVEQGHDYAESVLEDLSKTHGDDVNKEETKEEISFDFIRSEAKKGNSEMQLKLGNMYYEGEGILQDYVKAFKWYLEAAKQGNATAQKDVGFMYWNGEGISQDYSEAFEWFRKAAQQGNAKAQANLGTLYRQGEGVPQDCSEAFKWYLEAAKQGNATAQKDVGFMYCNGEGVPQDYSEAFKWFRKAAEQGHIDAQAMLGGLYQDGKGVKQDHNEAAIWYQKAAEQGDSSAQFLLGKLYMFSDYISRNEKIMKDGCEWLDKAVKQGNEDAIKTVESYKNESINRAETGDVDAQFHLGYCYSNGYWFPKDYEKAIKWLKLAAEKGNKDSQYNLAVTYRSLKEYANMLIWAKKLAELGDSGGEECLGNAYEFGQGVQIDYSKAAYWYRKAAEQGTPTGQFNLGCFYRDGKGVPQSDVEAAAWFLKAAEQGDVDAQVNLAPMFLVGKGVEKDLEKGKKWITEAANQGDEFAAKLLSKLEDAEREGYELTLTLEPDSEEESFPPEAAPDDPLEELYRDGLNEKNAGNFEKAIAIWKKILEKDFRHLNAINAIACAYAESGKLDMAKKYIDMAMKVGGAQADFVRINLAGILYDSGKFEEAEDILHAIECKDGRMIDNLTRVLVAQGKSERALELIEEFLAKEDASTIPGTNEDQTLQEIFTRGVDCILECKPFDAVEFLETYAHILPPDPLSSVYFNAGIHFLQEENDGVRALKCLSEAVRNKPDDSEAREALSDAALKVIADFGGEGKISGNEKAALATAYETVGNKQKALEIKRQMASVKIGEEKKPPLRLVTTEVKPSGKSSADEGVVEGISKEIGGLYSFWNEIALRAGEKTGLQLITSIEKNKDIHQILFKRGNIKGVYFVFSLRAYDWVVRIDIDYGRDKEKAAKEFFDKLEREASGIEKVFGAPLQWEKGKGRTCKIICPSDTGGFKTPEKWSSVPVAMVDMMVRLERAIGPVIEKLS